jgi:hypothetical protein
MDRKNSCHRTFSYLSIALISLISATSCHKDPVVDLRDRKGPMLVSVTRSEMLNGNRFDSSRVELSWDNERRPSRERNWEEFSGYGPDEDFIYSGNRVYATHSPNDPHALSDTLEVNDEGLPLRRRIHTVDIFIGRMGKKFHETKYYYTSDGYLQKTVMTRNDSCFGCTAGVVAIIDTITVAYEWQGGNILNTMSFESIHATYYITDTPSNRSTETISVARHYSYDSNYPAPPSNTNLFNYRYIPEIGDVLDPRHSTKLPDKVSVTTATIDNGVGPQVELTLEHYNYTYDAVGLISNMDKLLGPGTVTHYVFTYSP